MLFLGAFQTEFSEIGNLQFMYRIINIVGIFGTCIKKYKTHELKKPKCHEGIYCNIFVLYFSGM